MPVHFPGFTWAAGARRHRVTRSQARHVVLGARLFFVRPAAPPQRPDEAPLFPGDDQRGERLEVVGVELTDGRLRAIHAMPMRPSYTDLYEEAKACPQ